MALTTTHSTLEVVGTVIKEMLAKTGKNFKSDQKVGKTKDCLRIQTNYGMTILRQRVSSQPASVVFQPPNHPLAIKLSPLKRLPTPYPILENSQHQPPLPTPTTSLTLNIRNLHDKRKENSANEYSCLANISTEAVRH